MAALVFAGTAVAETVHYETGFTGYIVGNLCTSNPGQGWICGDVDALQVELLDITLEGANSVVLIDARSGGTGSTPSAAHEFTRPTADYSARIRNDLLRSQAATEGKAPVLQLLDNNGTEILTVGFRDADGSLDITNDTAWRLDVYSVPENTDRWYTVNISLSAKTYDLDVHNGAGAPETLFYEADDVPWNSNSDGKAAKIRFGSLDADDHIAFHFDHVKVWTP